MQRGRIKRGFNNYIQNGLSMDKQTWIAFMLFVFVSMAVFGFFVEITFYHFNSIVLYKKSEWFWRGNAFGPWIDIYGIGSVLVFALTYKVRSKPWLVALISGALLSVIELVAGMAIYYLDNGRREWNYNEEMLTIGNIGGFLCGRNIIAFCVAGPFLMYLVVPIILWLRSKMSRKVFLAIGFAIGGICIADMFYNVVVSNIIPGCRRAGEIYKDIGFKFVKFTQHDKAFWKLK